MKNVVSARIGNQTLKMLRRFAEKREISLSEYLRQILLEHIDERETIQNRVDGRR